MALPSYQPQPCVHDACLGLTRVHVHTPPPLYHVTCTQASSQLFRHQPLNGMLTWSYTTQAWGRPAAGGRRPSAHLETCYRRRLPGCWLPMASHAWQDIRQAKPAQRCSDAPSSVCIDSFTEQHKCCCCPACPSL